MSQCAPGGVDGGLLTLLEAADFFTPYPDQSTDSFLGHYVQVMTCLGMAGQWSSIPDACINLQLSIASSEGTQEAALDM